jgi:hypothetical protein
MVGAWYLVRGTWCVVPGAWCNLHRAPLGFALLETMMHENHFISRNPRVPWLPKKLIATGSKCCTRLRSITDLHSICA